MSQHTPGPCGAVSETRRERAQKYVRKSTQDSVGGLIEFAAAEVARVRQGLAAQVQDELEHHRVCVKALSSDEIIGFHRGLHWVLALLAQEPED